MNAIINKVIIITGASSCIGVAVAKLMAKEGAIVALAARREEKLKVVCDAIITEGGKAAYYVVGVAMQEQVAAMVNKVAETYGCENSSVMYCHSRL